MSEDLKPCPLCRAPADMERRGTARQSMVIACTHCGLSLESGDVVGLTKPEDYAWNRRVSDNLNPRTETPASIATWQLATFGPATNASYAARANRELAELIQWLIDDENHPQAGGEIADVMIVLSTGWSTTAGSAPAWPPRPCG